MRSRNSIKGAAGAIGVMMLASGALAGTLVQGWSLEQSAGSPRLAIDWSGPAPVEVSTFPSARQVVVTIPEATLPDAPLGELATPADAGIDRARLRPVTLADGRPAVQLALTLSSFSEPEVIAGDDSLVLAFATAPAAPQAEKPLVLTNEDVEALRATDFGSARAPESGAGQAEPAGDAFSAFYIPPALTDDQKTPDVGGATDPGLERTMALMQRTVTIDFRNVPLQDVLRTMASAAGMNIIINPGQASSAITLSLTDVPLGNAMDALLAANDLGQKIEPGGIVRIVPRSQIRTAEVETEFRAISINWVAASSLQRVLRPFLTENGRIEFAQESNVLLVRDVPENMTEIQKLIQRLDVAEKQVMMELRLVDMTEFASRSFQFATNITEANNDLAMRVGGPALSPPSVGDVLNSAGNPARGLVDPIGAIAGGGTEGSLSPFQLAYTEDNIKILGNTYEISTKLDALEQRGQVTTLANPKILSLNNTSAEIEIKRQIPYSSATLGEGGATVVAVEFIDVGVSVRVTPLITNHGYVRMEIEPEQLIQAPLPPGAGGAPTVDERIATASVIVKDEQTIMLGGLRQFAANNNEAGVPWLMRLPVFSFLFKDQDYGQDKIEMFMFVTPHIIKDPEPTTYEMGIYEKIDYNWDLPDYFFDEVSPRKGPKEAVDPTIRWE